MKLNFSVSPLLATAFASVMSIVLPVVAFAAEHEDVGEAAHEAQGIPSAVYYQGINFVIFAALGFYFLHKPTKQFFYHRREKFHAALKKAAQAKAEAEARKNEIRERLVTLENSAQKTLDEARTEAQAMSTKILQDAADISKNFREEANRTAQAEIARAKAELRDDLLNQSLVLSKKIMAEKMVEPDQKRLQTEFVDKISKNKTAAQNGAH